MSEVVGANVHGGGSDDVSPRADVSAGGRDDGVHATVVTQSLKDPHAPLSSHASNVSESAHASSIASHALGGRDSQPLGGSHTSVVQVAHSLTLPSHTPEMQGSHTLTGSYALNGAVSQPTSVTSKVGNDLGGSDVIANETVKTFSSVVGGGSKSELEFFPLADKEVGSITLPVKLTEDMVKTFNTTLYGYFLGPRMHFPIVQRAVAQAWGKYGFKEAMMHSNGYFFFRFNDVGGCSAVVEAGPLMIRGVPLFVQPWDPTKGLHKPEHTSCPLWVKLHNLPLVAFNKEGVSRVASVLGIPKRMDACTADMCDRAWGRPSFAKVLVDVWAIGHLKREIEVVIPSLTGSKNESVKVHVEYLWEPTQCEKCKIFGHKISSCVKAALEKKTNAKDKHQVDADGFTVVGRKQWRPKVVQQVESHDKGQCSNTVEVTEKVTESGIETSPMEIREEVDVVVSESNEPPIPPMLESVVKPTQTPPVKEGSSKGGARVDSLVHSVVNAYKAPTKPIKGILKNPNTTNRFSVLTSKEGMTEGSGAKENRVASTKAHSTGKADGRKEQGPHKGGVNINSQ